MSADVPSPKTMRIALRVLGEPVTVEAPQSDGPIRLDEALPLLRQLDDHAIGVAVRQAEAGGARISCCAGCAACCKAQPVPVTPPETYALWRLVETLPQERRDRVKARFADRVGRLREAGLDKAYLERDPTLTKEKARAVAERYFALKLACPFLEDDRCSIYAERPFVCRQYLVTSPAALCADPLHNPVAPVAMPLAAATATLDSATELLGTPQYTVPLVLALEYAAAHRQQLEERFLAADVFRNWLGAVAAVAG
jgi:Fe-S-cluster containining protein